MAASLVEFTRAWTYYGPDDGYTATLAILPHGEDPVTEEASDNGDNSHLFELDATATDITPGVHPYQITVDDGAGDVRLVEESNIEVLANLKESDSDTDVRAHALRMLQAIETLLEGKPLKGDQLNYSFENMSITRLTYQELQRARDHYRAQVLTKRNKARGKLGKGHRRKVKPRI